ISPARLIRLPLSATTPTLQRPVPRGRCGRSEAQSRRRDLTSAPPRRRSGDRGHRGARRLRGSAGRVSDRHDVPVRVLEPGALVAVLDLDDSLLVGCERLLVVLLEADAGRRELVYEPLDVLGLPEGDRRTRPTGARRRIDVNPRAVTAGVVDAAVGRLGAARQSELSLVELLRLSHVGDRNRRGHLAIAEWHSSPFVGFGAILTAGRRLTREGLGDRRLASLAEPQTA